MSSKAALKSTLSDKLRLMGVALAQGMTRKLTMFGLRSSSLYCRLCTKGDMMPCRCVQHFIERPWAGIRELEHCAEARMLQYM